jgi:site-specific recombinase XerD
MDPKNTVHGTIKLLDQDDHLETWIQRFMVDRKISGLAAGTLWFYKSKLNLLIRFCESQAITSIKQIDANTIRDLLQWLEVTGHNPGGRHAVYRSTKTFLRWWFEEIEPDHWQDPFKKVKPPKLSQIPLEPVSTETVKILLATCKVNDLFGSRDRSIILLLLDTGIRANELLDLTLGDMDLVAGAALIRQGKGGKFRTVFFGKSCRRSIRSYLKLRADKNPYLVVSADAEQLTYSGLRGMIIRRSRLAGINAPALHDFRRAFALGMLRNGIDVYTLQKLMGHADLQVLRTYLAQNNNDLAEAHKRCGLADRL